MSDKSKKPISFGNLEKYTEQIKEKYAKKDDIPTDVSDLNNDAKYQTESQVSATVAAAVAAADHLKRKKVENKDAINLEAPDADQYIYMVPKTGGKNGDKYDEYMVIEGVLEPVGDWAVDLSGYAQTEQVASDISTAKAEAIQAAGAAADEKLADYVKASDLEEIDDEDIEALFADD